MSMAKMAQASENSRGVISMAKLNVSAGSAQNNAWRRKLANEINQRRGVSAEKMRNEYISY